MAIDDHLGFDFHLGFIADEEGRIVAGPYSPVDLQVNVREDISPRATDLRVIKGKANLAQSIIMRLKTIQGELAPLGHPAYGSKHHRLIGEPNTENNRNLIKLYIIECLRQEPRIETILQIEVEPVTGKENRDSVKIEIELKFRNLPDPLNLVIPFSFEGPLA